MSRTLPRLAAVAAAAALLTLGGAGVASAHDGHHDHGKSDHHKWDNFGDSGNYFDKYIARADDEAATAGGARGGSAVGNGITGPGNYFSPGV